MKKCSNCGCENPDAATQCCQCGTPGFKIAAPPIIRPLESGKVCSSFKAPLSLRILIALGVWLVVSGITLYTAWQQSNHSVVWYQQRLTRWELKDMDRAITAFQQKYNVAPTNIEQLQAMTNDVPRTEGWFYIGLTDRWQHPFVFSTEGTNCLIISYGRDGKPGGKGIDFDLTSKNPYPKESVPTFGQFFHNQEAGGMVFSSFFCGALAAFLSFLTVRIPDLSRRGVIILVLSLGATLIGTLVVASMITAVHSHPGH